MRATPASSQDLSANQAVTARVQGIDPIRETTAIVGRTRAASPAVQTTGVKTSASAVRLLELVRVDTQKENLREVATEQKSTALSGPTQNTAAATSAHVQIHAQTLPATNRHRQHRHISSQHPHSLSSKSSSTPTMPAGKTSTASTRSSLCPPPGPISRR